MADLKAIVQRMIDAGESEENIASVIQSAQPAAAQKTSRDVNQSRMALAAENETPIQEPTSFMGGFTKHLLTKEPATVGALATLPAVVGGPMGLLGAGAAKAVIAGAPLAADLTQRASKAIYGQQQDPVTLGEVAGVAAGPAMMYGLPVGARALQGPAGAAMRTAGAVLDNPIAGAMSPRAPHIGRILGRVGDAMKAAQAPVAKQHFSAEEVIAIRDLMARGIDEARAIRIVKP